MSTTVVDVRGVGKRFVIHKEKSLKERVVNFGRSNKNKDDFWALRGVDLDISAGSTVGLVGPNGSGKSTLLKCIGGIIQPTEGTVSLRGRLAALLELGAGFHPDLTGRENVFLNASILGLSRAQTEKYFDAIVDFSGIERFIDTQVKFYSSGMYVRLAFAVAVHVDPDVLLVDEVLAVGDEPFQRKCMDRIRAFQHEGRTIVFVSHSLDQVAELCDRAVVLEHGKVIADGAPVDSLRVLRAEFEATRTSELAKERAAAPASSALQAAIVGVDVRDLAGAPVRSIEPGQGVVIGVDVESTGPELRDWVVGVGVDSPLGQALFGTHTGLMGLELPPLVGRQRIEVTLPQLWLGEGRYSIHGALAHASGPEIDRRSEAAFLEVRANGRSIGYVFTDPTVTTSAAVSSG
jgi:ABC-2 type transport system ATP-binding protein